MESSKLDRRRALPIDHPATLADPSRRNFMAAGAAVGFAGASAILQAPLSPLDSVVALVPASHPAFHLAL